MYLVTSFKQNEGQATKQKDMKKYFEMIFLYSL